MPESTITNSELGASIDIQTDTKDVNGDGQKNTTVDAVAYDSEHHQVASLHVDESSLKLSFAGENGALKPVLDIPLGETDGMTLSSILSQLEALFLESGALDVEFFGKALEFKDLELGKATKKNLEAMKETVATSQEAGKGGIGGKILGWVTTAFTAIAAVAICVCTLGVAAPASIALLTAAALMVMNQISSETGGWMQDGMTKMCGGNEMAGMIVFAVVVTALSLGGACAAGVSASSASTVARLTNTSVETATKTMNTMMRTLTMLELGGNIAVSGMSAATSLQQYKYNMAQADFQDARAVLAKIQEIFARISEDFTNACQGSTDCVDGAAKTGRQFTDLVISSTAA